MTAYQTIATALANRVLTVTLNRPAQFHSRVSKDMPPVYPWQNDQ